MAPLKGTDSIGSPSTFSLLRTTEEFRGDSPHPLSGGGPAAPSIQGRFNL
jgi:hypothetical protein